MYIHHRNILIMAIFAVIMTSYYSNANTETYKWTDTKGIIHYSDQPPINNEISSDVKVEKYGPTNSKTQAVTNDSKRNKMENINNSDLSHDARTTDRVKAFIKVLTAKGVLSGGDIDRIKTDEDGIAVLRYIDTIKKPINIDIISIFGSPDSRFSSTESTWNVYNKARNIADINTALDCITPGSRVRFREFYSALKREDIIDIGNNVESFKLTEQKNNRATYLVKYKTNGEKNAGDVVFVRIFGNWKIEEF